jgi:hypothetical protein
MPELNAGRDLDALLKATEENRAELKKIQEKAASLETAIQVFQNSRNESERKRQSEVQKKKARK